MLMPGAPIESAGVVAALELLDFLPIIAIPAPAAPAATAASMIHFVLLLCLLAPVEALVTDTAGSGFRGERWVSKEGVVVAGCPGVAAFAAGCVPTGGAAGKDNGATWDGSSWCAVGESGGASAPMSTGASVCWIKIPAWAVPFVAVTRIATAPGVAFH